MKRLFLLAFLLLIACNAEIVQNEVLEQDVQLPSIEPNITTDQNITIEPQKSCHVCDDNNSCTKDLCTEQTNFECRHEKIKPCCGDKLCEKVENCSKDCADCSKLKKKCSTFAYDYAQQKCAEKKVIPCCGNSLCDIGESCSCEDCTCKEDIDLSDFPGVLGKFRIVVGAESTSMDTMTANEILLDLFNKGTKTEALPDTIVKSLDTENLLLIGRPCENKLVAQVYGSSSCDNFLNKNTAIIKLYERPSTTIVLIGGYTAEDTKKAAIAINNPDIYLKGSEVLLDTSGSSPKVI